LRELNKMQELVIERDLLDYLLKRYGERMYKALMNYRDARIEHLAVLRDEHGLEASAIVHGEKGVYACYFGDDGYICSCTDQTVRKVICKHIWVMLLRAVAEGRVSLDDVIDRVIVHTLSQEGGE